MIAISAGLIRSGSIATWQIMREIVVTYGDGKAPALGTNFSHFADKWANSPKMYVTKLHLWLDSLKDYPEKGRAIAVIVVRDPRDVAVSLRHFRGDKDFDTTFNSRAYKNYSNAYYQWIEHFPEGSYIVIRYEDLLADRPATIMKIADFMGIPITEAEARAIDKKWNIEANKKRAKERHEYSDANYMAERHIRSGATRQWETELPEEYIARVEEDHGKWMVSMGYDLTTEREK